MVFIWNKRAACTVRSTVRGGMEGSREDSGVETARAEDSGYVGGKDGNRTLQDGKNI